QAANMNLEQLFERFPDRADIAARLGQLRFLEGDPDQARALLEAAVKEMPDDAPILIHLAKLELQANNSAKAEKWLRHALEVDPTDTAAEFTLGAAKQEAGPESAGEVVGENPHQQKVLQPKVEPNT